MGHDDAIKAFVQPCVAMTQARIDAGDATPLADTVIYVVDAAGHGTGVVLNSGPAGSAPTPATPGAASTPHSFTHPTGATPPTSLAITEALHGGRSWHAESDVTALTLAASDFPSGTELHIINHAGIPLPIRIGAGLTGYQNVLGASQAGVTGADSAGAPSAVLDTLGPLERCIIQTKDGVFINIVKFGGSGSRDRAWAPNTFYDAGEIVLATSASGAIRAGDRMACIADHASSASFATDQATKWAEQPIPSDYMPKSTGALSVKGNAANAVADGGDIAASADAQVLRRSGATLGFGTVATAGISDNAVTNAKQADMAANTMKANATAASADPADLAIAANQFPARSSTGNIAGKSITDFGLNLIDDADAAAARVTLGVIGTTVPVRVATSSNITLSGAQTIDGVAVVAGDRVLAKGQTTASQNGIYVVAAGAWVRATDFDGSPVGEVSSGAIVPVSEGTAAADSLWLLTTNGTIAVGTTGLAFARIDKGAITTSSPIVRTGDAISIPAATASIPGHMTAAAMAKLDGIATGAEVNIQPDYTQANSSADDFIKNKPDLTLKEDKSNRVTALSGVSTDVQYPSAKVVFDQLAFKLALTESPSVLDWAGSTTVRANEVRRATSTSTFQGILAGGLIRSLSARTAAAAWSDTEASNWTAVSEKASNFVSGATDPNTLVTPGMYVSTTGVAHANLFNAIAGWSIQVTALHTGLAGGPKLIQEGRSVSGVVGTTPGDLETYKRVSNNNGANWSAWERVLEPADVVLSTVSQAVQSSGFTAAWGNKYPINATAGPVTVTLASAVGQALNNIELVRQDATANTVMVVAASGERFLLLVPTDNAEAFTVAGRGKVSLTSNGTLPIVTDTNGIAGVSRLWLPTDANAAPVIWYSFRDLSRMTLSGSGISAMVNRGSLGATHNLAQATAGAQPQVDSTTNPRFATFDGGDRLVSGSVDSMQNGSIGSVGVAYTQAAQRSSSIYHQVCSVGGQLNIHPKWSDGNTYLDIPISSARISGNIGTALAGDANDYAAVGIRNGTNVNLYARGNQTPSLTSAAASGASTGNGILNVGSSSASDTHVGRIYEMVYYRIALTNDERDRLAAYLLWQSGGQAQIHASNPYRNTRPVVAL